MKLSLPREADGGKSQDHAFKRELMVFAHLNVKIQIAGKGRGFVQDARQKNFQSLECNSSSHGRILQFAVDYDEVIRLARNNLLR